MTQMTEQKSTDAPKPKVVVTLEGGMVTAIVTDGIALDVVVVDYDIDGAADEDIVDIPQIGGGNAECTMYPDVSETSPEQAEWVGILHTMVGH
mgnify:CR=1 FL=1